MRTARIVPSASTVSSGTEVAWPELGPYMTARCSGVILSTIAGSQWDLRRVRPLADTGVRTGRATLYKRRASVLTP